jgi:hypothetical protein
VADGDYPGSTAGGKDPPSGGRSDQVLQRGAGFLDLVLRIGAPGAPAFARRGYRHHSPQNTACGPPSYSKVLKDTQLRYARTPAPGAS